MEPDERSRHGIFLAFQYPVEIPGVSIANFLRTALQARLEEGEELDLFDFQDSSWSAWSSSTWTPPSPSAP
jgi:Fe-S cluster assembly ATP-binding protein